MNIKTKLSVQYSVISIGILLFFSFLVYYFSYATQLKKFREDLLASAKNSAILLIDVVEVDSTLLMKIHRRTVSLDNEEILITNSDSKIIYSYNIKYLTNEEIIKYFYNESSTYFSIAEKDGIYYKHQVKNQTYNVIVMATDLSRKINQEELVKTLIWSILFSTWLSILLSYIFSKKAIKPISRIIKSVKAINSSKLNSRLDEGNNKDELAQLTKTFNEMLANLEIAFKNQEDFVSNASHELRTPLSVMILESDYLLSREHTSEEYKQYISRLVNDLKKVNVQLNSLLELAHINKDNNIQLSVVRVDEIIFEAIHQIKIKYPARKIISKIQYPENESYLSINGNQGLLTIAIKNLVDNACKFSDDDVIVELLIVGEFIKVVISDKGIGIPQNETESIFSLFKRASNVKFKSGFGIGLTLVSKIMDLHKIETKIISKENEGTQFEMMFRRHD